MTNSLPTDANQNDLSDLGALPLNILIAQLSNSDGRVRQRVRYDLVARGHSAVPLLIQACSTDDQHLRWEIYKALSLIADPAAIPVFLEGLEDERFEIRWMASEGLIAIGRRNPENLVPLLHALLHHPNSVQLRESAHHIFRDLTVVGNHEKFNPLVEALSSFDWNVNTPEAVYKILSDLETKAP